MKKYIATITPFPAAVAQGYAPFELYYDPATGLLETGDGGGVYDLGLFEYDEARGEELPRSITDRELVETVYGLYSGGGWEVTDCIEYDD